MSELEGRGGAWTEEQGVSEPPGRGAAPHRRAVDTGGWGVLEQAGELTRRGEAFALATVVWRQGPSSSQQGSRAIITASGELHGWIGGACAEPVVIREAQQVISRGQPRLLLLGTPEQFASTEQFASGATTPKPLRARPDDTKAAPGSFPGAGQPAGTAQAR